MISDHGREIFDPRDLLIERHDEVLIASLDICGLPNYVECTIRFYFNLGTLRCNLHVVLIDTHRRPIAFLIVV